MVLDFRRENDDLVTRRSSASPGGALRDDIYLSPIGHFDIADLSSIQDACHHELSKYDLFSP